MTRSYRAVRSDLAREFAALAEAAEHCEQVADSGIEDGTEFVLAIAEAWTAVGGRFEALQELFAELVAIEGRQTRAEIAHAVAASRGKIT